MPKRTLIARIILWLFVILAGIVAGGSIYDELVVEPLWAGSPPESVRAWSYGVVQGRFFARFTPFYGLFSLALTVASLWLPRRQRKWALIAGLTGIIALLSTILFFMPIAGRLQVGQGSGLSDEEIVRLVNQWDAWQWTRTVLLLSSWFAGLRALSLPQSENGGG